MSYSSAFTVAEPSLLKIQLTVHDRKSGAYSTASLKPLQALCAGVLGRPR